MAWVGEILLVFCAACAGLEYVAPASCGNGVLEMGEVCDDGNLELGDGCAPSCDPEVQDFYEV